MKVYFIAAPEIGRVKIGIAEKPSLRFSKIQSDNPCQLVLLAVEDGGRPREIELHKQFEADHVRGEWFNLSATIQAHIDTLPAFIRPKRERLVTDIAQAVGVSKASVSMLLNGKSGSLRMAIRIFMETGHKVPRLAHISDEEIRSIAHLFVQPRRAA